MAVGIGLLSMSDEPREPSDDTSILARCGLRNYVRRLGKEMRQRNPMGYFGILILTISPGAWPWATTRLHFCRRQWSCPEGESFPSWTLRPPPVGAAFLFLSPPPGGGASSSSSSSEEEGTSGSSRDESDTTRRRELIRVPVAFFLAFFSGTTWGAGTSSFAKQASAGPSGRGAGQLMCPDVTTQSYPG